MHEFAHPPRRQFLGALFKIGGVAAVFPSATIAALPEKPSFTFNVRDLGASPDGKQLQTQPLQEAINRCAQAGGGTVYFPPGTYLTGSLILKSRVHLHLDAGATLLGSKNLSDYQVTIPKIRSYTDNYTERSLLYAENLESISISGPGTIDGQGAAFKGPYKVRPYLIRMISCRDIAVRQVTIKNSPMWVQHYLACDRVSIDGITVDSHVNANNDGIDIDGCHQVRISNCDISSGDDAIVLKSTLDRPCKNVVISNCILSSDCNAFKLGTESNGGFENILLSNCAMHDTHLSGIALELVDGGLLDQVSISHVTMQKVNNPIFIRLGNRARPFKEGDTKPSQGKLRNINISHVQATGANKIGCSITGLPQAFAEDVSLSDIRISCAGGGTEVDALQEISENPKKYPEYTMFGTLPAYGFYCRHARNLRLDGIRMEVVSPDQRPAIVCDDIEELELSRVRATTTKSVPLFQFTNVKDALVQYPHYPENARLLRVNGSSSRKMSLRLNDMNVSGDLVEVGPEVDKAKCIIKVGP